MHSFFLRGGDAEGINVNRENSGERIEVLHPLVINSSPGCMNFTSQIISLLV